MNYEVTRIENCFADSRSYEYVLPIDGKAMLTNLPGWEIRLNEKLRRPVGIAENGGVIIKFILAGNRFRVSFPEGAWEAEKQKFELFLEKLTCTE